MSDKAALTIDGKVYEFAIITGTEGEKAIDMTNLRTQTGCVAYDPSYANVGSCKSAITYIDGEKGILRYRGIPIEQFDTEKPNFVEVAWLLIFGKLPNKKELTAFSKKLTENAAIHEAMKYHFEGFPITAPPMAILSAMINALSCFYPQFFTIHEEDVFEDAAARLISKIRTIAAYSYRSSRGRPFIAPHPKLRYCANFLHMMFSEPYELYQVDPAVEDALNLLLILHADHEQNCSTSTVRMVGSSRANLFASCAAGVCALWGPLHGGANTAVIEMLQSIHTGNISPEDCIKMAKDKNSSFRLMGFGHRVYKSYDPRARVIKKQCDKVLATLGVNDPLLDIALKLEELALKDSFFQERGLYPNVDFYSGIILRAMGIPVEMFTVMFAIGRLPGWIAQWREQHLDSSSRIMRPRQIYIGNKQSDYIPLEKRG
ncbi:MAG TPA: citrate synthase [Candidatus Sumerlaeota bacterium]|nr:citrate synthase [Candidatus Sumerlaeota bacterium]HON49714.1 citrate synthase [Candidatus Sumerlaeota bacterium]HOR64038.1 citrate synthase [Candidatus Sumerlaeota bacterium]HPL75314.1 citrate synthase [Candidatus Sumerlaeota bacterium]